MGCGGSKNKKDAFPPVKKEDSELSDAIQYKEEKQPPKKKKENNKNPDNVAPDDSQGAQVQEEKAAAQEAQTKPKKEGKQKPPPVKTDKVDVNQPKVEKAQPKIQPKPNLNISELGELPVYKQENPQFEFKDGELSPIQTPEKKELKTDLSDVNSNGTQPQQPKKVVIRRQKTTQFNWVDRGSVEIKTISFKIKYSHTLKGFKVLKSKENYQTTLLSWMKNEEEDVFEFIMKDTMITELRSGINTDVESPEIRFTVDPDGRFDKITNLDEFLEKTLIIQKREKTLTDKARKRMKKLIEAEIHKNWRLFVENWIYINNPDAPNYIVGQVNKFGKECLVTNISNFKDEDEIKMEIKTKLMDEKTYYQYLGSKNMFLDRNRHWELTKDSSKKKSNDPNSGQPPHRNMRLEFFMTSKDDLLTAMIDPYMIRPYITNYENIKKIVFDMNRDLYINVEYEAQTNVFLWNDLEDVDSDDFLINEMVKFQDACNDALQDMISELSEVKRVPLTARYEKPKDVEIPEVEEEEKGMFDTESVGSKYTK